MGISDLCVSYPGKCPIQTWNSGMDSVTCRSAQTLSPSTQAEIHKTFLQPQIYPEMAEHGHQEHK